MWYIILIILVLVLAFLFLYYQKKKMTDSGLCIFMYHQIEEKEKNSDENFLTYTNTFALQLDLIKEKGYHPVTLSEVETCYINKTKLPHHSVLLTFDDGYKNNYTDAYPLILEKKIPIVIFVSTGEISVKENMLTWEQVEEMKNSGLVEFSSHGVNHKRLRKCSDEEIRFELTESKKTLENRLKQEIKSFCYPYGAFDSRVRKLVYETGYIMDFGTRKGINPWPWKGNRPLLRAHVMRGESLQDFESQLKTGRK